MKSPYANPYGAKLTQSGIKGPTDIERRNSAQASNNANLLRLLSSAAPAIGTIGGAAIGGLAGGGLPGAMLGGTIGGAAGNAVGAMGGEAANQMTDPYEKADMERKARFEAFQSILRGM